MNPQRGKDTMLLHHSAARSNGDRLEMHPGELRVGGEAVFSKLFFESVLHRGREGGELCPLRTLNPLLHLLLKLS